MKKPLISCLLLSFIFAWALIFAAIGARLTDTHPLVELLFYVIAGVGWAIPLVPVMRWVR